MMNTKRLLFQILFLCILTVGISVNSKAETIDCTAITSLPAVISSQGVYCLTGHVSTSMGSGNAIEITANNVSLDLNGWKVGGQAAGTGTLTVGIYSTANNVTIKNGTVRGFYSGVVLLGRGPRVTGLLVDQNTYEGIRVGGQGSHVRNNKIVDTGGSTTAASVNAYGVVLVGSESVIENNIISGLTATGDGYENGINVGSNGENSTLRSNIISDADRPAGTGESRGIIITGPSVGVISNTITNFDSGILYVNLGDGTYARNIVINSTTAYTGGTDGPGNHP